MTIVTGSIGNGGQTIKYLEEKCGVRQGDMDLVFLDHDKTNYLSYLRLMMQKKWFKKGLVVVADNVLVPGDPDYRHYMSSEKVQAEWSSI